MSANDKTVPAVTLVERCCCVVACKGACRRPKFIDAKVLRETEALEAWRKARTERDRIALDGRSSHDSRVASERSARAAEIAYDKARGAT